jgi:hypothetical protein
MFFSFLLNEAIFSVPTDQHVLCPKRFGQGELAKAAVSSHPLALLANLFPAAALLSVSASSASSLPTFFSIQKEADVKMCGNRREKQSRK